VPIIDLGTATYQATEGGLYPGGINEPSGRHLEVGLAKADQVEPLNESGQSGPDGAIVMVALGVSNTLGEFKAFSSLAASEAAINPSLVLVNGAQVGQSINRWVGSRSDATWETVTRKLQEAGASAAQVQVAWVKIPSEDRGPATLEEARVHAVKLETLIDLLPARFPNIRLVYFSSRSYGGYIPGPDSEPNAYHDGFAVKWAIEGHIEGAGNLNPEQSNGPAPWVGWGPYLWADGTNPRSDGLFYECSDYQPGGVHPATGAADKIATLLLDHFRSDPTSRSWFTTDVEVATTATSSTISTSEPALTTTSTGSSATTATVATSEPLPDTEEQPGPGTGSIVWLIGAAAGGLLIGALGARRLRRRPER
jgi:hypothetical protein